VKRRMAICKNCNYSEFLEEDKDGFQKCPFCSSQDVYIGEIEFELKDIEKYVKEE